MSNKQKASPGTTSKKSKPGRKNEFIVEGPKFTHEELREALFNVQDILERSQIQFVLLDEIAQQMFEIEDPILEACEVSVGVLSQDFTESGSSTLRSMIPEAGWGDKSSSGDLDTLTYRVGSVPVVIWIIHNNLDVFRYPDVRFYYNTEYRIPNPFKEYWKKRDFIK